MRGLVPRAPLVLGLAGTIPFLWGVTTLYSEGLAQAGLDWFGPRFVGPHVQIAYGTVILAFMSGVLWGFATRALPDVAPMAYGLSVVPALWAFFFVGGGAAQAVLALLTGFAGILALDWLFWRQDLTPHWWLRLRSLLTLIVGACLLLTLVRL